MVVFSKSQTQALEHAKAGRNLFLTGGAGTGKSTTVHELIRLFKTLKLNCSVTASTGLSALPYGGKTIHQFSGIGLVNDYSSNILKRALQNSQSQSWIKSTDVLIIDEISTISDEIFDLLSLICSKVRNSDLPFGGMQVIVVGDFYQLPAVPNRPYDHGGFAFNSKVWQQLFPPHNCIVLEKVYRQENQDFLKLLEEVRIGVLSEESKNLLNMLSRPLSNDDNYPHLFSRVIDCQIANRECLLRLPGEIKSYESHDFGTHKARLDFFASVPKILELKIGAPVMLLRNLSSLLKNGSTGTVIGFGSSGFPLVNFGNCVHEFCELKKWTVDIDNEQHSRLQIPLALAFSYTIHKAQGQTLEKGVVDMRGLFAPGHMYTALSRFSSLDYLQVLNFKGHIIKPNKTVVEYYVKLNQGLPYNFSQIRPHSVSDVKVGSSNPSITSSFREDKMQCQFSLDFNPELVEIDINIKDFILEATGKLCNPIMSKNSKYFEELKDFLNASVQFPTFFQKVWSSVFLAVTTDKPISELLSEAKSFLPKGSSNSNISSLHKVLTNQALLCEWDRMVAVRIVEIGAPASVSRSFLTKLIFHMNKCILTKVLSSKCNAVARKLENLTIKPIENTNDDGYSVLRYLGGWAIHKVTSYCTGYIINYLTSSSVLVQERILFLKHVRNLGLNLIVSSSEIHETTSFLPSLRHTDFLDRGGLTHITDDAFQFFISLENVVEGFLNQNSLFLVGSKWLQNATDNIVNDQQLFSSFLTSLGNQHVEAYIDLSDEDILKGYDELMSTGDVFFCDDNFDSDILCNLPEIDFDITKNFNLDEELDSSSNSHSESSSSKSDSDRLSDECERVVSSNSSNMPIEESSGNPLTMSKEFNDKSCGVGHIEVIEQVDLGIKPTVAHKSLSVEEYLFRKIVDRYLHSRGKEILSKVKNHLKILKQDALRKKICKKKNKDMFMKSLLNDMRLDRTENCLASHSLLKGKVLTKPQQIMDLKKEEIVILYQAYGLDRPPSKVKKENLVDKLVQKIIVEEKVPYPQFLKENSANPNQQSASLPLTDANLNLDQNEPVLVSNRPVEINISNNFDNRIPNASHLSTNRRKRFVPTADQIKILEVDFFQGNAYINKKVRAIEFGVSETQIESWHKRNHTRLFSLLDNTD